MITRIIHYNNGVKVKLKNRSVTTINSGYEVIIEFGVLDKESTQPRALHSVKRDKAVYTTFKISKEAAQALVYSLQNYLENESI